MAHAGEDHGDAQAVCSRDDLSVADRSAGLNDSSSASLCNGFQSIGEREEGV